MRVVHGPCIPAARELGEAVSRARSSQQNRFSETNTVYLARTHPPADDEQAEPGLLPGLLTHLDAVYGFALTLTGDAELAADLTEDVFVSTRDELWATLGEHGLRDRLLARCVSVFADSFSWRAGPARATTADPAPNPSGFVALLRGLPWNERAVIALVDQLGLAYASGAAVMGIDRAEFRTLLHRGRAVLFVIPSERSGSK